jgi:hypothetical protein
MSFFKDLEKEMSRKERVKVWFLRFLSWIFVKDLSWKAAWNRPYIPGLGFLGSIATPDEKVEFK